MQKKWLIGIPDRESQKKFWKIMKLTVVLIIGFMITASATNTYSQKTRLDVNLSNISIKGVLGYIEQNSEFVFLYRNDDFNTAKKVNIDLKDATINQILDEALSGEKVVYDIYERQIVIRKAENLPANTRQIQKKEISGTVKDTKGIPLPGVSVVIKGTTSGTVSDSEGKFRISVPADSKVLTFSFVGMKSQEITITGKTILNTTMLEETFGLDEVVAVGYGTQKKTSLTAAVGSLNGSEFASKSVSSISNSLGGQLAGIISAQTSGEIGNDNAEIHIRGVATFGNNAPLIVVDGIPRDMNKLDPYSIESVSVLKDAAAVAPYGMAGANGVILITTKKGQNGKPVLTYNGYSGFQNPTTIVKMLNSYDYANIMNTATYNADPKATLPFTADQIAGYKKTVDRAPDADPDKYPNTNAMDLMRNKNTMMTSHNLSLSGGTDIIKYYMGIGYLKQDGMWSTSNLNKYNLMVNLEAKATKTTTLSLSINANDYITENPSATASSVFAAAQGYLPTDAYRFSNGDLANSHNATIESMIKTGSRKFDQTNIYSQLSVEQQLPFIKGLSAKAVFSYDPTTTFDKNWTQPPLTYYNINTSTTPYTYTPVVSTLKPNLYESEDLTKTYTFQGMLNYSNTFGKHVVSGLAVMESRESDYNGFWASRQNYDINIQELNLGSSNSSDWGNGGSSSQSTQVGYIYRLNYGYDNKYLVETSGRYDGNYYFAPGKKFGFFPSLSVGWRLSEEKFIKDNAPYINNLKLRGSWGQSGNLAGGPFQYSSAMGVYGGAYAIGGTLNQGAYESLEPNPNITWEKANKTDIGIDAGLWKGLFDIQCDYFYEKRNNMLISPSSVVPSEYGIGIAQVNAGVMSNSGIDLSLGSRYQFSNGIKLEGHFNFTYAKNKILRTFENPTTLNDPNRRRTGRPLNTPFGLKSLGLFQVSDFNSDGTLKTGIPVPQFGPVAPGDIKWADINKDGKVDASDETALGYPILPQIIYGFGLRGSYKNFDLSTLFQGAAQANSFVSGELAFPGWVGTNAPEVSKDYWTPTNTRATYPRLFGDGGNANNHMQGTNDFFKRDGSYLRLKNIEIGYALPRPFLEKLTLQSVRIYASAQNLLTFSKIKNLYDPEMGQSGGGDNNVRGWYCPQQKVISFGLNVTF